MAKVVPRSRINVDFFVEERQLQLTDRKTGLQAEEKMALKTPIVL